MTVATHRSGAAARLGGRARKSAGELVGLVLVVAVFGFVLPRVANYGAVWDVIDGLSSRDIVLLAAAATINLLTFAPPWMAALPGLSLRHSLVMSQASTAAANVVPGGDAIGMALSYSMLRRWGFKPQQVAVATGATAIWNIIANVSFAVAAVGLLAVSGQSDSLLTTAALVGACALALLVAAGALVLRDERYARAIGGGRPGRRAARWYCSTGRPSSAGPTVSWRSAARRSGSSGVAGSRSHSRRWRAT